MVRFPSNYQRCYETNVSVCISTFGVIMRPCYMILLSISILKSVTIRGSRAETFGLYLHPNDIQTTQFCVPVDTGQSVLQYTLLCVILVIPINIELTVNERLLNVSNVNGRRLRKERCLCDTSLVCFLSSYVEQYCVLSLGETFHLF